MDLQLRFLPYHQGVLKAVQGQDGGFPCNYDQEWTSYIVRVFRAVPGQDPDRYHFVSGNELQTISPRLFKAVHSLLPDGKPFIYDSLRRRKYRVAANTLHPFRETVEVVQIFALVASGTHISFTFASSVRVTLKKEPTILLQKSRLHKEEY